MYTIVADIANSAILWYTVYYIIAFAITVNTFAIWMFHMIIFCLCNTGLPHSFCQVFDDEAYEFVFNAFLFFS